MLLIRLTWESSGNCVFARWEVCRRQCLSLGCIIRSEQKLQKKIIIIKGRWEELASGWKRPM